MRATLAELLPPAVAGGYAVPCFNVFGFDEALACVRAAETLDAPVILATNREMVAFTGVEQLGAQLGRLAEDARVPVCAHLDHSDDVALIRRAVESGYSSVMYDGSQLPLADNIAACRAVVEHAHAHGVSVEGEIGSVPYSEGRAHVRDELTDPDEAERFAAKSGVDAVAVAVGNVHRLREASSTIDFERLASIRGRVSQPLVIHGASGVADEDRRRLAGAGIAKFNIGTSLRQSFARALRASLASDPEQFDRLTLFAPVVDALAATAGSHLEVLGAAGRAADQAAARTAARTAARAAAPAAGSGVATTDGVAGDVDGTPGAPSSRNGQPAR